MLLKRKTRNTIFKTHEQRVGQKVGGTKLKLLVCPLSKLWPPIIHWCEHKSFSTVVSMKAHVSFQWDSFPLETICRASVALLARLIELCVAQFAHAILFPQLDCEVGASNLHIEDPQSLSFYSTFSSRENLTID